MTVVREQGRIRLAGACTMEDAEPLLRLALEERHSTIDWTACESAHTAVIQVLVALRPELRGPPANAFLQNWIAPSIGRNSGLKS
jgi:hypothetical protein